MVLATVWAPCHLILLMQTAAIKLLKYSTCMMARWGTAAPQCRPGWRGRSC